MFLWYSSSISGHISIILASCRQSYKARQHLLILLKTKWHYSTIFTLISWLFVFIMLDYLSMLTTSSRISCVAIVSAFKRRWNLGQIKGWFMIGCLGGQFCCWKWSFFQRASRAKNYLRQRPGRSKCKMLANFVKSCVNCHVRKVWSLRLSSNMCPVGLLIHVSKSSICYTKQSREMFNQLCITLAVTDLLSNQTTWQSNFELGTEHHWQGH